MFCTTVLAGKSSDAVTEAVPVPDEPSGQRFQTETQQFLLLKWGDRPASVLECKVCSFTVVVLLCQPLNEP